MINSENTFRKKKIKSPSMYTRIMYEQIVLNVNNYYNYVVPKYSRRTVR